MWLKLKSSRPTINPGPLIEEATQMHLENLSREELQELLIDGLGADSAGTFKFFRRRLAVICRSNPRFSEDQIDYVAQMLSAFAMGTIPENFLVAERLLKIKETYQLLSSGNIKTASVPPNQMEEVARQILFESSADERNFLKLMTAVQADIMGSFFFLRSAVGQKEKTLLKMSDNFKLWRERLAFMEYQLAKSRGRSGLIALVRDSLQLPKIER